MKKIATLIPNKSLFSVFISLLLISCSSTQYTSQMAPPVQSEIIEKKSELSTGDKEYAVILEAVEEYLKSGQISAAESALKQVPYAQIKSNDLKLKQRYLSAQALKQRHQWSKALNLIKKVKIKTLSNKQAIEYLTLKIELYQATNRPIKLAETLNALNEIEPSDTLSDKIWQTLQPIPPEQIHLEIKKATNKNFKGWLELSYIAKRSADSPNQLQKKVNSWNKKYPYHPLHNQFPPDIERALNVKIYTPKKIAVLLPLSGKQAKFGEAVQYGMLSNLLKHKSKKMDVLFYDTNPDVNDALDLAIDHECDFLIGPLLPDNVDDISNFSGSIQGQLMLNKPSSLNNDMNQFYFTLSPTEEAKDIAHHLNELSVYKPIIISNNKKISQRMVEAFQEEWLHLNDEEPQVIYYKNIKDIKDKVEEILYVKQSKAQILKVKNVLGHSIKADFRSREDVDALYLIASPNEIKLLKPFVDVSISVFASPITAYVGSRSHVNSKNGMYPNELNGLIIHDMPWLLKNSKEKKTIESWSHTEKSLYTMGYDSLSLINKLAQMRASRSYVFQGRTGELRSNQNGLLLRTQSWGKFRRGQIKVQ